jgi:RNA polymerase sigma-70 factor, ECF subfamily
MTKSLLEATDADLVDAARTGSMASFGELYRRHYAAMVGIAYCAVPDVHLAEDAAQEAFAVACQSLGRLRKSTSFAAWIASICRRTAIRAAQTRRHIHSLAIENAVTGDRNGEERAEFVREYVQQLPAAAREVVVLHYFSGLSHQCVAEVLDISVQAVHGRLIRARRAIAEELIRNGFAWRTR